MRYFLALLVVALAIHEAQAQPKGARGGRRGGRGGQGGGGQGGQAADGGEGAAKGKGAGGRRGGRGGGRLNVCSFQSVSNDMSCSSSCQQAESCESLTVSQLRGPPGLTSRLPGDLQLSMCLQMCTVTDEEDSCPEGYTCRTTSRPDGVERNVCKRDRGNNGGAGAGAGAGAGEGAGEGDDAGDPEVLQLVAEGDDDVQTTNCNSDFRQMLGAERGGRRGGRRGGGTDGEEGGEGGEGDGNIVSQGQGPSRFGGRRGGNGRGAVRGFGAAGK